MDTEQSSPLTCTRLAGALGAELRGLDLRRELTDDEVLFVREAIAEHLVVFLRDQDLTDEQHLAFAQRFGRPSIYPIAAAAGSTKVLTFIEEDATKRSNADNWHTDMTFAPVPPALAFLSARVIPDFGGDTLWASLYALYDAQSPPMQTFCETLSVRHEPGDSFWAAARAALDAPQYESLRAEYTDVTHPLVIEHPHTGRKALYVSGHAFMIDIPELDPAESRLLLDHFRHLLDDPNVAVRWRWQPNDLAIWDELATNHRALSDHHPRHRLMRRCTVDGAPLRGVRSAVRNETITSSASR